MGISNKEDRWKRPPKQSKPETEKVDVEVALLSYLFHQYSGMRTSTIYFTPGQVLGQHNNITNRLELSKLLDSIIGKVYGNQYRITLWKTHNRTMKMYRCEDIAWRK